MSERVPDVGQVWRCRASGVEYVVEQVRHEPGLRPLVRVACESTRPFQHRWDESLAGLQRSCEYVREHLEVLA